jgi:succinyl-diaminopimelate desuccinylase
VTSAAGDPVPLLKELIACASVTPESAGVLDIVARALRPLGFAVERLRFEGGGSYPVDNLFATRGRGGKHLLFAGHTDVVPPGDLGLWSHPPFAAEEADGFLYGRGAADMKSGVAAFIAGAARAIADRSADSGTISIAISNDEEAESINGTDKLMAWAAAQGHRFDFAIVGEPSSQQLLGDSIKIGRRGSVNGRVTVTGVQGHVAYPHRAENPLPVLGRLVAALSEPEIDTGSEHFPPSNLEFTTIDVGNPTTNVIPSSGTAAFNIRFNDLWTPETLRTWLEEKAAAVERAGCTVELQLIPPFARSFLSPMGEGVETLTAVLEKATGTPTELSTAGGTSDARFIAQYCPVVEFGLPGQTMHKTDERVAVADVEGLAGLYAQFIRAYFDGARA